MNEILQQGIAAYKSGRREEARKLFITAVRQTPNNELAWGWLYQSVDQDHEKIYCLQQILRINPKNEKIAVLLAKLTAPVPSSAPVPDPQLVEIEAQPEVGQDAQPEVLPDETPEPAYPVMPCPHCGQSIRMGAPRCAYCGRDVNDPPVRPAPAKKKSGLAAALGVIVILLGVVACIYVYSLVLKTGRDLVAQPTPTRTPSENAWYACTLFIEDKAQAARIDAQRYAEVQVVMLDNGRYRVDIGYAKAGLIYTCILADHADGNWELIDLTAKQQ